MAGVRARRRPRRSSVNFRRLKWIIVREAALRIILPERPSPYLEREARKYLNALDTDRVLRLGRRGLELDKRRGLPPWLARS